MAVYHQLPITFVPRGRTRMGVNIVMVVCRAEPVVGRKVPEACRHALIARVEAHCRKSRFPMCLVFGRKDSVYFSPDGRIEPLAQPPSGGLDLSFRPQVHPIRKQPRS